MSIHRHFHWPCDNPGPWAGVWVESVGLRDCKRYNADLDPRYFCVHLLLKGNLRLKTGNGVDVVLTPGDLFSMWPHIACQFFPEPPFKGDQIEMIWIRLRGPLAPELMRRMGTTEDRPWTRALHPKTVVRLFRKLEALAKVYPEQADLAAVSILHQIAAACAPPPAAPAEERPLAHRIREAMEQHLGSGMSVEDYARAFRISRVTLFLRFKETFGKSPIRVLDELRIRRAKELLRETNMSVREVSSAAGYRHPLYFSRQFRKKTGVPPTQYRKER